MEVLKIAAIGILAGILALTVKKSHPELAIQVSIAAGILIFLMLAQYLAQAVDFIKEFALQYTGIYQGITIVLKIVGIAYICEFAVQLLRDVGENSVASKVELGGKLIILVMTLPMLSQFATLVLSLLK